MKLEFYCTDTLVLYLILYINRSMDLLKEQIFSNFCMSFFNSVCTFYRVLKSHLGKVVGRENAVEVN